MLQLPPWNILPLTVQWLTDKYNKYLDKCPSAPSHIHIINAPLEDLQIEDSTIEEKQPDEDETEVLLLTECNCNLCNIEISNYNSVIYCPNPNCNTTFHATCLASLFTKSLDSIIPIEGDCPACKKTYYWKVYLDKKKVYHRLWILKEYSYI